MRRVATARGGYTLIELLAYVLVLGVIVNLCTSLFLSGRRVYALGELSVARMDALRKIERDFRQAARTSDTVVAGVEGVSQLNPSLVLRGATGNGTERYAVWRLGGNGALLRETYERTESTTTITSQRSYAIGVKEAKVARGGADGALVTLSVTVQNKGTSNTVPAENMFVARLRGGSDR